MTLALLLTAVTGAWAQSTLNVVELEVPDEWAKDNNPATAADLPGFKASTLAEAQAWTGAPAGGMAVLIYAFDGNSICYVLFSNGKAGGGSKTTFTKKAFFDQKSSGKYYYTAEPAAPDVEVTTNAASAQDLFTEASFTMPASDVTVDYLLVRDMQDEANPVAFSGLPTNDEPIIVKKGSDGKYQPAEALTIQLIDPLAAAEAQNIIAADGITVKVLVGAENELGAIDYDLVSPITLDAFLADMTPGYYWIKAEPTDENSPYDGTVYSSEFTVVEQYDLTVKPANDFSKGKIESVTVGTETVTPDATTGEATKTGIAPDTEVKLKAKRGYVIEKVEAKKPEATATTITIGVDPNGHSSAPAKTIEYTAGETWAEVAARYDWLNTYDVYTVYHTDYTPGNLKYVDSINGPTGVKPSDTVDPEKTYHWGD